MILPGVQALFGFQLMAVFNAGFTVQLSAHEQMLHLFALILIAISAILDMAPAAYHRQAKHQISKHFIALSSQFLVWAMPPLAIGTCLDIYLVSRLILKSVGEAFAVTAVLGIGFLWMWFILPRLHASRIENLPVHELIPEAEKSAP